MNFSNMLKRASRYATIALASLLFFNAATAYVQSARKGEYFQIVLYSIKAVDVAQTVSGIRAYDDIISADKVYQQNDVIYLAATIGVKNTALSEYKDLGTIKDRKIDLVFASDSVDLSLAKSANPMIVSSIYSGYDDQNIGLIGIPGIATLADDIIPLNSKVVSYDKKTNEARVTFKGRELNKTAAIDYINIGASINTDGTISIPALRAGDSKVRYAVGKTVYGYDYDAPREVQYTVILPGITKNKVDAENGGDFSAKLHLSR